jgi:hypothetical protein
MNLPSAYLNDANTDLTVRYLTDTDENSQVPLRFKAGKDGDYTLVLVAKVRLMMFYFWKIKDKELLI